MLEQRMEEIKRKADSIQGWVNEEAGMKLYELVRFRAPNGYVVELGSWKGRSTLWLAHAVQDRGDGVVHAVDTWRGTDGEAGHSLLLTGYGEGQLYAEFEHNMREAGVWPHIVPHIGETLDVFRRFPNEPKIGLLFIDACHDYEAVKADFEHWSALVADGGFVVFDDVPAWAGPTKFIQELPAGYRIRSIWQNNCVVQKIRPEAARTADLLREVYQSRRLFHQDFIAFLFARLLERSPNEPEREALLQYLGDGGDPGALIRSILQSEEFQNSIQRP